MTIKDILPVLCGLIGLACGTPRYAAGAPVDFERDVKPIFASRCFQCHGPEKRDGGLRLTNRRDAFTAADSGETVLQPGRAADSLLIERVSAQDVDERMPPEGKPLTKAQIATLTAWIDQGANWPENSGRSAHWAYVKPVRPSLPKVRFRAAGWHANAIDLFIAQRLLKEKLKPNRPAAKPVLLRRVSLALTGLPPTIEQVEQFVNDDSPDAYEKAVDRLLDSPGFGERWAQHWLDLARYADSNGFQADQLRDSWAYRDWVISAFNNDMPFDQFVVEQLAGDLLPEATMAQRIATGFHRTVTCNVEAGVHPEENRTNQVFDRVNTTGTVFLGTTIECCQCHNHKYDPFTQEEYYRLFAYFNNTPLEVKKTSGVTFDFVGPNMPLPLDDRRKAKQSEIQTQLTKLQQSRVEITKADAGQRRQWEADLIAALECAPQWQVVTPSTFECTGGEDHEILEDGSVLVGGSLPGTSVYTIAAQPPVSQITALRIDALTHESLPGMGPGRGDEERPNFILSELEFVVRHGDDQREVALQSAEADYSQKNWEVAKSIDGDRKTGWAIGRQFSQPHWATFLLEKPLTLTGGEELVFTLDQNYGRGRTMGRVKISVLSGNPAALDVSEEIKESLLTSDRSRKQQRRLDEFYANSHPGLRRLDARIQKLNRELSKIEPPTTLVMMEMDESRETSVMIRGDYLNTGAKVSYGTPATLHPLDPKLPQNRLGLARWLVDPDNPLIARVTVNRWWAQLFGRGLHKTPEDFGTQSEPPSHPKLLDWLAVEFVDSGWSVKHMLKLMVMSATYRQSAEVTPDEFEADPVNALYARGPRFRLPAETIRDNGLSVSGLLSRKMGGPPIMPYQPDGIWRAVGRNAPKWKTAQGEDRFRRGVYVVWRRAAPYPSFVSFDAPDRGACVVERPRTNTPLQALTLLNDPAYVEMSLGLARRMMTETTSASPEDKVIHGFRLCLSRRPTNKEVTVLADYYQKEYERYSADPKRVGQLLKTVPGYRKPKELDDLELAAWHSVASVLLNLDEMITN